MNEKNILIIMFISCTFTVIAQNQLCENIAGGTADTVLVHLPTDTLLLSDSIKEKHKLKFKASIGRTSNHLKYDIITVWLANELTVVSILQRGSGYLAAVLVMMIER